MINHPAVAAVRGRAALLAVVALLLTACANGAAPAASDSAASEPAASQPAAARVPEASPSTAEDDVTVALEDPEQQQAAQAWSLVFDSSVPFADKAPHLPDAEALRSTVEAYAAAGEGVGGISLSPTAVTIDGDEATVTYDVLFGENAAYSDQTGTIERVDGVWVVARDEFCGFMASARTPCE